MSPLHGVDPRAAMLPLGPPRPESSTRDPSPCRNIFPGQGLAPRLPPLPSALLLVVELHPAVGEARPGMALQGGLGVPCPCHCPYKCPQPRHPPRMAASPGVVNH